MKFFSKQQKLRIILEPGMPGNRATGTPSVPAIYIKFEGGVANVTNEKLISLLKESRAFKVGEIFPEVDPYAKTRRDSEPQHTVTEIKYGHVDGTKNAGTTMSPDNKIAFNKLVEAEALKLVTKMMAENAKNTDRYVSDEKVDTVDEATHTTSTPLSTDPMIVKKTTAPDPIEDDDSLQGKEETTDEATTPPSEDEVTSNVSEAIDTIINTEEANTVINTEADEKDPEVKKVLPKVKAKVKTKSTNKPA